MDWLARTAPDFLKHSYQKSRLILRSAVRSLGPRVARCRVRDVVIQVGISSEMERFRADTYATKEPETLDWLDQELRPRDVFFDVGANIGLYSIYAAKLNPRAVVFAFEPESQNFSRLCRNIFINRIANVIPCSLALSDREGMDYFRVSSMAAGSALHSLESANGRDRGVPVMLRQGVFSTTLDALAEKYGLPLPTLLKIDVDGAEEKIVEGAGKILTSATLRSTLIELNFRDAAEFTGATRKITGHGFKLARKSDWVWEQNGIQSRNCIFHRP